MVWVLCDSDHWQIALQITDPSSRQRGCPKTKSKAKIWQKRGKRKFGHGPQGGARQTIGHNINSLNNMAEWLVLQFGTQELPAWNLRWQISNHYGVLHTFPQALSRQMLIWYFKLGYNCFLPHSSHFIIHLSLQPLWLTALWNKPKRM
jgi:hypothetical protein